MDKEFRTKSGLLLATGCVRLVVGGRGAYIEFEPEHIVDGAVAIPDDQRWRLSEKYRDGVFYDEYRTTDECNVMVYYQRRYVGYADYNPGMFYVSPSDLEWEGELPT